MTSTNPDNPASQREKLDAALRNAHIYYRRGDMSTAAEHLQAVIEIQGDNIEALELLGDVRASEGDLTKAAETWQRALQHSPGFERIETKYAKAVLQISEAAMRNEQLKVLTENPELIRRGGSKGNNWVPVFASMLLPGLGHYYLGDNNKAYRFGGIYLAIFLLLAVTGDLTRLMQKLVSLLVPSQAEVSAPPLGSVTILLALSAFFIWIYALVDASALASKQNKPPTNPDTEPDF